MIDGVADGYEAFVLASIARNAPQDEPVLFVARDGQRLPGLIETLQFVASDIPVLEFPAWDCLPYDRVSPGADAAARRLDALGKLIALKDKPHRAILVTTANALLQRLPPQESIANQVFSARPGNRIDMAELTARLEGHGFDRVATVRDIGEYAVRGGIVDLFAPGSAAPVRLDFFGDTLESIRTFDPASQRTIGQEAEITLQPMSEITLTPEAVSRFRRNYIDAFGAPSRDDALYASISEGRRFAGMEHWLPLFHEQMATLFDYMPTAPTVFEHLAHEAIAERADQISDYYEARQRQADGQGIGGAIPYKPVPPDKMYLDAAAVKESREGRLQFDLTPFDQPAGEGRRVVSARSSTGHNFSAERADPDANVFDQAVKHIAHLRASGNRVVLAGWTEGSLERLIQILDEHGLQDLRRVLSFDELEELPASAVGQIVLRAESGFVAPGIALICEQDILG